MIPLTRSMLMPLAVSEALTLRASTPASIRNPELWSPESPALYKLVTEISDNGKL
ncbi:MAG: hypothetical protein K2G05_04080, partial [Duncaniella sp.]|nr:hypothetical protein [Duncaniella sp.]